MARILVFALLGSVAACLDGPPALDETTAALSASNAADRAQLALRWAPVHFQDVDQTGTKPVPLAVSHAAAGPIVSVSAGSSGTPIGSG